VLQVRAAIVCVLFPLWFICRRTQIVFGGAGRANVVPFAVSNKPEDYLEDLIEKTNLASRQSRVRLPPRRGFGGGTLTGPGGSLDYAGSHGEGKAVGPESAFVGGSQSGPPEVGAPKESDAGPARGARGGSFLWSPAGTAGTGTLANGTTASAQTLPAQSAESDLEAGTNMSWAGASAADFSDM
jgi:hypothetical protein